MKLISLKLDEKLAVLVTDEGEFVISEEDYYSKFSLFGINDLIDEESAELLRSLARVRRLIKKGMTKLAYGDNTAKNLYRKLLNEKTDGIYPSSEEVKAAVVHLKNRGYIREKEYLERCIEICLSKLYGRSRIYKEMLAKGFSSAMIKEFLDAVPDEVFEENLRSLAQKHSDKEKKKLFAYLLNAGYSVGMISSCVDDF